MISITVYQYLGADNLLGSTAEYFAGEFALDSAVVQPIKQRWKESRIGKGSRKEAKKTRQNKTVKSWRRAEENM